MARKTKSLGPANDAGVPKEEIVVAKLVQNAKARGMTHSVGSLYRKADGSDTHCARGAVACCALGASHLRPYVDMPYFGVAWGNDRPDAMAASGPGHDIGAAFRDAMT